MQTRSVRITEHGMIALHIQPVIFKQQIQRHIVQRLPAITKLESRFTQRHPRLENTIVVFKRKITQRTLPENAGIFGIAALQGFRQVVNDRFSHGTMREVVMRLAGIFQIYATI